MFHSNFRVRKNNINWYHYIIFICIIFEKKMKFLFIQNNIVIV